MDELGLSVNGELFQGWKTVSIVRSIEQLAWMFRVGYTRFSADGDQQKPLPIFEGDAVTVKVDSDKVLVGYVDDAEDGYATQQQDAAVSGRSKTGDLVDCAAIFKTGQWRNSTLSQIAKDLLGPFKLDASVESSLSGVELRNFSIQEAETVFEALDRAARMRGVLLTTTSDGDVRFTRAGATHTKTQLEYGVNILRGARKGSWKDRFSAYTIKTQAPGKDDYYGSDVAQLKRSNTDDRVTRYRPMTMMAENEDSGAELQARIDWERNIRAGRSRRLTYVVQGWRDDDGDIWAPNVLVKVKDERLSVKDELLIVTATLSRSMSEGTTTTLELTHPSAFDVQPLPPKKPAKAQSYFDAQ